MLRTTCPTTQHHNPADWNIFCTRFLLAENIKIPCLGHDSVQFDRRRCLRGRNHVHLHGQPWLHNITPMLLKPSYQYCLMLALFLWWYLYVCLRSSNTVAWFYLFLHTVLRYCHYQHLFLHIFFTPLNYTSSLPNASIVNAVYISTYLPVANLQKPHETFKKS